MDPRHFVAALLALALPFSAPASAAEPPTPDPAQVVVDLYAAHRPWADAPVDLADAATLSRYFSTELAALLLRNAAIAAKCPAGEMCGLDFDPILAAQDFGDAPDLALRVVAMPSPPPHRYTATFRPFGAEGDESTVLFDLVRSGDGWRISDIVYPALDGLSLTAHLAPD